MHRHGLIVYENMLRTVHSIITLQLFFLLLFVSSRESGAGRTTVFPIFNPVYIQRQENEVEEYRESLRPRNWSATTNPAHGEGLLYAGKREFNWIVIVEMLDEDPEKWSIGNLVTFRHVLTTCASVIKWDNDKIDSPIHVLNGVRIGYGTPRLNGNFKPVKKIDFGEVRWIPNYSGASGIHVSSTIVLHEKCRPYILLYNWALIELSIGIRPQTPLIGYMPVLKLDRPTSQGKGRRDLSQIMNHQTPCYIASYGKPYYNIKGPIDNIIEDFKVKYRVYYMKKQKCLDILSDVVRTKDFDGRYLVLSFYADLDNSKLWCFMPRKKVGSICDHDRGAPLVCNGVVYGLVARGVKLKKCNNLVQFPVVVSQVTEYVDQLYYLFETEGLTLYEEHSSSPRFYLVHKFIVAVILINFMKYIPRIKY